MTTFEKLLRESTVIVLVAVALLVAAAAATAQVPASGDGSAMSPEQARLRYEQRLAQCNAGTLAAPARHACVQNAGRIYDMARAGQPVPDVTITRDGRATVVPLPAVPATSATPGDSSSGTTSADGRATIVPPVAVVPPAAQ